MPLTDRAKLILTRILFFFALTQVILGVLSLRGGLRFQKYVKSELGRRKLDFRPFASIIVPCRGLDQGLIENLASFGSLNYPDYELLFVLDDKSDPAFQVIANLRNSNRLSKIPTKVLIAGNSICNSQKVHNLLHAVENVNPACEVLVFADSDARPDPDWLKALVEPLADETVGAATGYRWFVPVHGGVASNLRSVWNASIASALGADRRGNFCWGGSTAIRRRTFESANVRNFWRQAASDDFAMMHALRAAGLPIHFVPACLIPSYEDCTFRELIEFTTRQLKITRVYAEPFWKAVLIGSLLFVPVFSGLILLCIYRLFSGAGALFPVSLFLAIFALGAIKSIIRLRSVESIFRSNGIEASLGFVSHVLLWPIATALYLINSLAALFSRRIEWRGIVYELNSPNETAIIRRASRN